MRRILCFRGGGMRAYSHARIIQQFEAKVGKQCHEIFDLIVGTSAGGIIAAGLSLGVSGEDLLAFFETEGPRIFEAWPWHSWLGMRAARYDTSKLISSLYRAFGDVPMAMTLCPCIITSSRYEGLESVVWQSWKHTDMPFPLVAAMSSAAPTYFAPVVYNQFHYFDGGFWANNPTAVAVTAAKELWPMHDLAIADIACPGPRSEWVPSSTGLFGNAAHLVDMFMRVGEHSANKIAIGSMSANSFLLSIEPPILTASHALGDATRKNLLALQRCADWSMISHLDKLLQIGNAGLPSGRRLVP